MLSWDGASNAKKALWGSVWMCSGCSRVSRGHRSLLGQPLRKYMAGDAPLSAGRRGGAVRTGPGRHQPGDAAQTPCRVPFREPRGERTRGAAGKAGILTAPAAGVGEPGPRGASSCRPGQLKGAPGKQGLGPGRRGSAGCWRRWAGGSARAGVSGARRWLLLRAPG